MTTYLKNMAGWNPKDLKNKSFANVQELFKKAMKRVNTFVDMDTELVEGSETREEESSKRAEVIPDKEEVAVDAIPLATKPLSIVDWKIIKEGKIVYYQIIRAYGISNRLLKDLRLLVIELQDDEMFRSILSRRYGLGLILYRAPCAIKGVLRKNTENLNNKIIKLNEELSDCETDLYNYKIGLSQVKARLVEFKNNEIKFCERIRVLERDLELRDNKIENLRNELEEVKKEKESIDFKIEKFDNASKDLDSLLGNKRLDKDKKGLPEFFDDTVTDYSRPTPSIDVSKDYTCKHKRHVNDQKQVKPVWNCSKRVNHHYSTRITHPNPKRNMIPQAILMRSGRKTINVAKPKAVHNDVKASACWVWKLKNRVIDHVSKYNNASMTLKIFDYINAQGRFKSGNLGYHELGLDQKALDSIED
ncbi:hypothetical protein Tco_1502010 [Tanacetum coccineum]